MSVGPAPAAGSGMWRFAQWLPVTRVRRRSSRWARVTRRWCRSRVRCCTELGVGSVAMKCEHLNPTGSFKDRIASVAVTLAVERGLRRAGGDVVGQRRCRGGGLRGSRRSAADPFRVGGRRGTQKLLQIDGLRGERWYLVEGLGHDAAATEQAAVAVAAHAARPGRLSRSSPAGATRPRRWRAPRRSRTRSPTQAPETTLVYAPVGGGGLVAALGRGFAEVARARPTHPADRRCAARRLRHDAQALAGDLQRSRRSVHHRGLRAPGGRSSSTASALSRRLSGTGGHLTEVSDEQIYGPNGCWPARAVFSSSPPARPRLAGALADAANGRLDRDDRVVVLGTGAGYKDGGRAAAAAGDAAGPDDRNRPRSVRSCVNER